MAHGLNRRTFLAQASSLLGWATASCRPVSSDSIKDLTDLSAASAVSAMRNGDISAESYARALLERAQRLEGLNAFRVLNRDTVLESARAADRKRASGARPGLLHGLLIPVKDSVNTAAYPTSNGTRALAAFQPQADASVIKSLVAHGAIVMGKTNLHELSVGWTSNNRAFGAVHNPYNAAHIPGGSSGGSAAAVAARMAPLAIAEDTMGSIRVPASMCGLCGLRPTFGRYPNDGIMPLSDEKFDQVGAVARSIEDLILFDTAVTGDRSGSTALELKNARVGIADFLASDVDPDVERVISTAFDRLRNAGVTFVRTEAPESLKSAMQVESTIIFYEIVSAISRFLDAQGGWISFEQLLEQAADDIQAAFRNLALPPNRPSQAVYEAALAQRRQIQEDVRALFARYEIAALAFPTVMTPPPKIGDEGAVLLRGQSVDRSVSLARNVSLGSCAGLASLSLPAGMSSGGLPIGLEFDALSGTDRHLLALGLGMQKALGPISAPTA